MYLKLKLRLSRVLGYYLKCGKSENYSIVMADNMFVIVSSDVDWKVPVT